MRLPPQGTWVPKYLVDDRDGVWTVKANLIDEAAPSPPPRLLAALRRCPRSFVRGPGLPQTACLRCSRESEERTALTRAVPASVLPGTARAGRPRGSRPWLGAISQTGCARSPTLSPPCAGAAAAPRLLRLIQMLPALPLAPLPVPTLPLPSPRPNHAMLGNKMVGLRLWFDWPSDCLTRCMSVHRLLCALARCLASCAWLRTPPSARLALASS